MRHLTAAVACFGLAGGVALTAVSPANAAPEPNPTFSLTPPAGSAIDAIFTVPTGPVTLSSQGTATFAFPDATDVTDADATSGTVDLAETVNVGNHTVTVAFPGGFDAEISIAGLAADASAATTYPGVTFGEDTLAIPVSAGPTDGTPAFATVVVAYSIFGTAADVVPLFPGKSLSLTAPTGALFDQLDATLTAGPDDVTLETTTEDSPTEPVLFDATDLDASVAAGTVTLTAPPESAGVTQPFDSDATAIYVTTTELGDPDIAALTIQVGVDLRGAEALVNRIYGDLFDRAPDPTGLAHWVNALRTGTSPAAVANAITSSDEFRNGLIAQAYDFYLDRVPSTEELAFWRGQFNAGLTPQLLEAAFAGSQEFYNAVTDGVDPDDADATWVAALYLGVLDREPSDGEIADRLGDLDAGYTRAQIAVGFLLSPEHLGTVLDGYYQLLLHRSIDPTGRTLSIDLLRSGGRIEQIVAAIVASPEYAAPAPV